MTQRELADALRRPQSYVAKVERGSRRIDPIEWSDWLAALGVEIKDSLSLLK